MIFVRLIQSRNQMIGARPCGAAAHCELAGQLGLARSRQRGTFFVPYSYPLHAFVSTYGVGKRVERVTHHAEYLTDTDFVQRSNQKFSDGFLHSILSVERNHIIR